MKPRPFDMKRPTSLAEATRLLAEHGAGARLLAGGQSLVPLMNLRTLSPAVLIDLNGLAELSGISEKSGTLTIGAMTRQATLLADPLVGRHLPLLVQAARHVGHVQTRSRGTIGGSIAFGDPAAELPVALSTLGARLRIVSDGGERDVALSEFHGEGCRLSPDEMIASVDVPVQEGGGWAFRELARNRRCLLNIAAVRTGHAVTVTLGGYADRPMHLRLDPDADRLHQTGRLLDGVTARHDLHGSAEYRRQVAEVLLAEVLKELDEK